MSFTRLLDIEMNDIEEELGEYEARFAHKLWSPLYHTVGLSKRLSRKGDFIMVQNFCKFSYLTAPFLLIFFGRFYAKN